MNRVIVAIVATAILSFGHLAGGAQATGAIDCIASGTDPGPPPVLVIINGNPGEIIQALSGDAPRNDAPRPPELAAGAGADTIGEAIQDNCTTPGDFAPGQQ